MKSQKSYTTNHQIRARNVRVVSPEGHEVLPLSSAILKAQNQKLDLILINNKVEPPLCKIQNLGKFLYEEEKKRRNKKNPKSKEIQLHPNIAQHDLDIKIKQAQDFLQTQHPVTLKMKFRGRENTHQEIGVKILEQVVEKTDHLCQKNPETRKKPTPPKNGNLILLHLHPGKPRKE